MALALLAAFAFAILQTQSGSAAMEPRRPRNDDNLVSHDPEGSFGTAGPE